MKLRLLLILLIPFVGFGQRNMKDSVVSTPMFGVHYGGNWSAGDLADRYGYLNHVGGMAGYKTSKNWLWGIEGNFIFGSKVKMTGIFDLLTDSFGNITDMNGDVAQVYTMPRGFNLNAFAGKVIPIFGSNKNSGLMINLGVGYLQHKMKIETQEHVVPVIETQNRKGYDRFTSGINTSQFVGYSYMSDRGFVNFYAGFYAQQGFTKNRRNYFWDQPDIPVDKSLRFDGQVGFKVGWFIPIYKRQPKEYYFN